LEDDECFSGNRCSLLPEEGLEVGNKVGQASLLRPASWLGCASRHWSFLFVQPAWHTEEERSGSKRDEWAGFRL